MKTVAQFGILLVAALLTGCSPAHQQAEGPDEPNSFTALKIGVPADPVAMKPGQTCNVTLLLFRSLSKRQDVDLSIVAAEEIKVESPFVRVKSGDSSAVHVRRKAHGRSQPGLYEITVFGNAANGSRTRATFQVQILSASLEQNCRWTPVSTMDFGASLRLEP